MKISVPRRPFNIAQKNVRPMSTPEMSPERMQKEFEEDSTEFDLENPIHIKYMFEYLTIKCDFQCVALCYGSHVDEPLRRKPFRLRNGCWNYKPQQCLAEDCEFGYDCQYAHNTAEVLYHPLIYKTTHCGYRIENSACVENGVHCPFAHQDLRKASLFNPDPEFKITHENTLETQIEANRVNLENYSTYKMIMKNHIKIYSKAPKSETFDLETFKTRFCDKKFAHEEEVCVFYHNSLDKRRKILFDPEPCKNIFNSISNLFDMKTCPNGDTCKFAHNNIEILYHQDIYRTKLCTKNPCNLGECCPYIHQEFSQSTEDQKKELNDLIVQHSLLSNILEQSKSRLEKLKRFMCVYCKKSGTVVMHCGHILCKECSIKSKCNICNTIQKKINIIIDNSC